MRTYAYTVDACHTACKLQCTRTVHNHAQSCMQEPTWRRDIPLTGSTMSSGTRRASSSSTNRCADRWLLSHERRPATILLNAFSGVRISRPVAILLKHAWHDARKPVWGQSACRPQLFTRARHHVPNRRCNGVSMKYACLPHRATLLLGSATHSNNVNVAQCEATMNMSTCPSKSYLRERER